MKARVELTEDEIMEAIVDHIEFKLGIELPAKDVRVLVKSSQNYKAEWEVAKIKCEFDAKPETN